MAARWVGTISPPGVIAYKEWDTFNIWQAGQAAFMRNWSGVYVAAKSQSSLTRDQFDIAPLPRGSAGIAAVLGGNSYAVSQHSLHKKEAVMLVRFLCGRDEQVRRSRSYAEPPTIPELYNYPEQLARNPYFSSVLEVFRNGVASRPSTSVGKMYPDVSRSYYEAVNRVLSRKRTAAQAAAELQDELVTMLKAPRTDANANRYQGSSNALR
jgi:trehalose/maltose transport system substrate-binding protein